VDLVGANRPINGIAGVDPEFIGQEGDNLPSLVRALGAYRCLPLSAECRDESENCEN
jgi:hypothetical protein